MFSVITLVGLALFGLSSGALADSDSDSDSDFEIKMSPEDIVATAEYPDIATDQMLVKILTTVYDMNLVFPVEAGYYKETNTVLLSVYLNGEATVEDLHLAIELSREPVFK